MSLKLSLIVILLILSGCGGETPKMEKNITTIIEPTQIVPTPEILEDNSSIDSNEVNDYSDNLTKAQQDVIRVHNEKRNIYFNDSPLKYSLKLESEAQNYADILASTGEFRHDPTNHQNNYGENLYAFSKDKPLTIDDAMPHWFDDEEPHYHYEDGSCDIGYQCGHYTQVIWQNTREVGCATAKYQRGRFKNGYIYVCKYYKAGNISFNGENLKPYCSNYDMSDIYLKDIPASLSLADKKFDIELISEDRVNCIRDDKYNSYIKFNSDLTKAYIPDFQIFNNGEYKNSLEFDNISIDGTKIILKGTNKNITDNRYKNREIYMNIEILGENSDYYSANIEWNGLDSSLKEYSRNMKAKIYK